METVGLAGLAIGPTTGGFVLAIAPWQVLLLVNVPIAVLAMIGVRFGIAADDAADLHRDPVDLAGAVLGTVTIVLALVAPTLFVNQGPGSWTPWATTVAAVVTAILFVVRERSARYPLLDLELVAQPLVSSGLAFKAAAGLATAGLGYLVTLQLQLDSGWSPAHAALGMLPQVVVLIAGGAVITPFVQWVGLERAAWLSATMVVFGLAVYALLNSFGYVWVALALVLVAAGMRVVGVVAGVNVLRGLPKNRTTIGAALVDTATEVASAVGIAVTGTILAGLFTGDLATSHWSTHQTSQFQQAVTIAGLTLTVVAAALVGWGIVQSRPVTPGQARSGNDVPQRRHSRAGLTDRHAQNGWACSAGPSWCLPTTAWAVLATNCWIGTGWPRTSGGGPCQEVPSRPETLTRGGRANRRAVPSSPHCQVIGPQRVVRLAAVGSARRPDHPVQSSRSQSLCGVHASITPDRWKRASSRLTYRGWARLDQVGQPELVLATTAKGARGHRE